MTGFFLFSKYFISCLCTVWYNIKLIGLLRVYEYSDTPHLNIKSSMNIRHCRNQWIAFFGFFFFLTFLTFLTEIRNFH